MAEGDFSFPIAPTWIRSAAQDANEFYAQGAQLGARAAMERARLQEASIQNQAELAMKSAALQQEAQNRQAVLEQSTREANQRNLMEKSYRDAQIGLRQQELNREMEEFKLKSAAEARRFAGQQRVGAALKAGTPIERALFESPEMLTPGVTEAMVRRQGTAARNYGTPTLMPVPGAPGTSIAYREGSPAMHVVREPDTSAQRIRLFKLENDISAKMTALNDLPLEDPSRKSMIADIKRRQEQLKELKSETAAPGPVPIPPPQTATGTAAPQAALPPPRRTGFVMPPEAPGAPTASAKPLTKDLAREFMRRAGGDRKKAEEMAREAGYTF